MTQIIKLNATFSDPRGPLPDILTGLGAELDARTITGKVAGQNLTSWASAGPLTGWSYPAPVTGREPQYAVVGGVAAVDFVSSKSSYWAQVESVAQDVAPPVTVTMLMRVKAHATAYLTAGANISGVLNGLWATLTASGQLQMAAIDGSGATLTIGGPIPAGEWIVVSMVYAPAAKLYVNGVLVASGDFSTMGPRSIIPRLLLGASQSAGGGYFNGYIAHIDVHRRALTALDVDALNKYLRDQHGLPR